MATASSTFATVGWKPKKPLPSRGVMLCVYRTLSLRYLSRRWFRAALMVASIALGVGILVATHALNQTMSRAALAYSNPMAGIVDFVVTNGDLRVPSALVEEIRKVPGVSDASPRVFENAKLIPAPSWPNQRER